MNRPLVVLILISFLLVLSLAFGSLNPVFPKLIDEADPATGEGKQLSEAIFKTSPSPAAFIELFSTPQPVTNPRNITTPNPQSQRKLPTPSNLLYPNAMIVSETGTELILESRDSEEDIAQWYQDEVRSSKMRVINFMRSQEEEFVVTKLSGMNEEQEVHVEIRKDTNYSKVRISVITRNFNSI